MRRGGRTSTMPPAAHVPSYASQHTSRLEAGQAWAGAAGRTGSGQDQDQGRGLGQGQGQGPALGRHGSCSGSSVSTEHDDEHADESRRAAIGLAAERWPSISSDDLPGLARESGGSASSPLLETISGASFEPDTGYQAPDATAYQRRHTRHDIPDIGRRATGNRHQLPLEAAIPRSLRRADRVVPPPLPPTMHASMARHGGLAMTRCLSTVARTAASAHHAAMTLPLTARPSLTMASKLAASPESTMPPGFSAAVGRLKTFALPDKVSGSAADRATARAMLDAWQGDGILQIAMTPLQKQLYRSADAASRRFFARPSKEKRACVDGQSYAGYVASGEEMTDGIADYSEIFTVTKDLSLADGRVADGWPCHGPCPWPDGTMKAVIDRYMADLGASGEKLLQLIELGLEIPAGSLTGYTEDGWHHMRVLRFPARHRTNGKGKAGRGIGSHTDYGLLVIANQDHVGGLFVRPPQGGGFANWQQSAAGMKEDEPGWTYVPPSPGVYTVFPGDMLQYMTNNRLLSTPHKVGLNTRERFAFAYFHEPNFRSVIRPLPGHDGGQEPRQGVHYGTHFTNMCLRNYPDRVTTKRMVAEDRFPMLATSALRNDDATTGSRS
ncbi:2-oxoglutarate-dependent ethylene/succinate-forming enzyme [Drechmeria coniospora]|uniref:2-oxoglutarate-dependent ethylene/succinate-forming enzyme n=1 Tax=Drechmeria coniospora TaxID=98403 RepID=A0A151GH29_DRECN|nr:2-oxoglutarate-dependent ethylene/succinate-forming enzyme [Drechmeria coniospora]KYK56410.1 2-oxoglutarate-dependent ethylene/succinate-forming enzyme [Drechmeria coniospora]